MSSLFWCRQLVRVGKSIIAMCACPSQGASSSGLTSERASSRGFSGDPYDQRSGERCSQNQKLLLGSSQIDEVGRGDDLWYEKDVNFEQGATDWDWDVVNDGTDTGGGGGPSPPQPRPLPPIPPPPSYPRTLPSMPSPQSCAPPVAGFSGGAPRENRAPQ